MGQNRIVSREGASVSITVSRPRGPGPRPWEPAGAIDVEQLVAWAFGVQRADRQGSVGMHQVEIEVSAALSSSWGFEPRGRSSDGCAALGDIEHMGCRIDRRVSLIRDDIHPAAVAVDEMVKALEHGRLVREYGRLGIRPDGWAEPKRWFRPVVWVRHGEEGQWEWEKVGNGKVRITRVIPTVTLVEIARRRESYAQWWEALDQLAWRLSMRALGFVVQPPSAPREPWLEPELPLC